MFIFFLFKIVYSRMCCGMFSKKKMFFVCKALRGPKNWLKMIVMYSGPFPSRASAPTRHDNQKP